MGVAIGLILGMFIPDPLPTLSLYITVPSHTTAFPHHPLPTPPPSHTTPFPHHPLPTPPPFHITPFPHHPLPTPPPSHTTPSHTLYSRSRPQTFCSSSTGIEKHDTISITNFGTRVACYSDVLVGESYVMFLTQYQGSLSAKYDDIFGATAADDQDTVEEILEALGTS